MHALLVIDVQKALVQGAYLEQAVLDAINTCIHKVRKTGGIVVFIQHCHATFTPMKQGNEGWQLHEQLQVATEDLYVEKEASDAFYDTELQQLLIDQQVDHLIVTGLQTEYCVDATCRSALSKGFAVTLITDGHTTGDSSWPAADIIAHHNLTLSQLAHPHRTIALATSEDLYDD